MFTKYKSIQTYFQQREWKQKHFWNEVKQQANKINRSDLHTVQTIEVSGTVKGREGVSGSLALTWPIMQRVLNVQQIYEGLKTSQELHRLTI